jgi:Phospholipase_D-nuclease N-terminal
MIRFELAFGLVTLGLWIYCLVDVIGRGDGELRNLPKLWWLLIVLFFPFAGSIAYLVAGRPQGAPRRSPHERAMPEYPEYDRPGRAGATAAESDEEFLRMVRERAEQQRRVHREARLAAERGEYLRQQRKLESRNRDADSDLGDD